MDIITSCRVFITLLRFRKNFKRFGLPPLLEIYNKKGVFFTSSRWNLLFSKAASTEKPFIAIHSLPHSIPSQEDIVQYYDKAWGFLLRGRYFSPSNPQRTKDRLSCYLSEWFFWAVKYNYQPFCRFFDDETVEMFLISRPFVELFEEFYKEYNPFHKYSYFNPDIPLWCIPEKGWSIFNKNLLFRDFASFYVLSLHSRPAKLKVKMEWQSNMDSSIRTHLEFTRIFEASGLKYSGEIPAVILNPYQGQGFQWVNLNSVKQAISVNCLSFDSHLIDYPEFCLQLAPDRYQRHKIAADILSYTINEEKRTPTLGDFGGNPGLLHNFLPSFNITVVDQYPLDYPFHFLQSEIATRKEIKFDYTTALDVLEHIPPPDRRIFLSTIYSLSRYGCILSFPAADKKVSLAENLLFEFEKKWLGRENDYLSQHLRYPLPDNSLVEEFCQHNEIPFLLLPNAFLPHWLYMMCLLLVKELSPENEKTIESLLQYYNENYYSLDNRLPAYRSVWVIGELARSIKGKESIMKRSDEEIQQLWSPCKLPLVLRSYGLEEAASWLENQKNELQVISQGKTLA